MCWTRRKVCSLAVPLDLSIRLSLWRKSCMFMQAVVPRILLAPITSKLSCKSWCTAYAQSLRSPASIFVVPVQWERSLCIWALVAVDSSRWHQIQHQSVSVPKLRWWCRQGARGYSVSWRGEGRAAEVPARDWLSVWGLHRFACFQDIFERLERGTLTWIWDWKRSD